ncbi:hypothetical protein Fmac_002441 [Flemingia macrophylla]|uniref:Uncharacterized protein n=1 Tax=Flemingia macrophylla TaxID=520843 RepID=A0ABD1NK20_9FABA
MQWLMVALSSVERYLRLHPLFEKKQGALGRRLKVKPLPIGVIYTPTCNTGGLKHNTMAFTISTADSEANKMYVEEKDSAISSQLQLKSSLSSSQSLNKEQVLRRIRHRKSLNRIKATFQTLLGTSKQNTTSTQDQMCLQQQDAFSSP